jgi:gliding motility-associated-like protein
MKHLVRVEHIFRAERFFFRRLCPLLFVTLVSLSSHAQTLSGNLVVPIVFHIVSQNPAAITDQQIADAVTDLNNAFAHNGPYAGPDGINTGIRFCLAKTGPDGGNTTGITRTQSVLANFDRDLENGRLKNLVSWDARAYCNIWLVDGVKDEYLAQFACGNWSRRHDIGYGSFDSPGDSLDGIVTKETGSSLASLMGTYLGLKYTFVLGNCANSNCNSDGDGVCDTPPASVPGSSCNAWQNSCITDTVSGFTTDMHDLTSNFMSLSGPCTSSFTAGQAAKMRGNLNTMRNGLLLNNKCDAPCGENIVAGFTRDNWMPKTGDQVQFTSTSTGGTNYQWTVNDVVVGGNSPTYSLNCNTPGKIKVSLKVYNSNASCFASYSDFVIVNCGVMARFYPNVRQIASKENIMTDSILFTNRSVNASSSQWWMSNNQGMDPQVVSTSFSLNYTFKTPGYYSVWLVAANGSCTDTSEKFNFPVYDPTVDGTVSFNSVECYQQTKVKVSISVCNNGYTFAPAGTPVSFYDSDPRNGKANRLSPVYLIPDSVAGKCCATFTTIIDVGRSGLNQIYAVFNDNGSVPFSLPNTKLPEWSFSNNVNSVSDFRFHVTVSPDSATLQPGDTVQLIATAGPGTISSYSWSDAGDLSCTGCDTTVFTAAHKVYSTTKKMIATTSNGCVDSAVTILQIPSVDDYQVTVDSIECAGSDSLHATFTICNHFSKGSIPMGLTVSFYDTDPDGPDAHLLGPVFSTPLASPVKCSSFEWFFKRSATGKVFAVVNNDGRNNAALPGLVFDENRYDNNTDTMSVIPFTVTVSPSDTIISRLTSVRLNAQISGGQASTFQWEPVENLSCSDCASPVATPAANVDYRLTVQNKYACMTTGTVVIKTFSGGRVNIPNGFTPNNDGHDDVFYVLGSAEVKLLKDFSVFNRWGQKVFQVTNAEANDPRFGWNGYLNGKPAETGTYVYFVTIAFSDGSTQLFKGTVTLIR